MDKKELLAAQNALELVAKRHNTTVKMVRAHIQLGILSGFTNPDPAIQAEWTKIPREGEYPTPEEVVNYYAKKFRG